MPDFVVIYYAPSSAIEKTKNMSPEEMQKGMEAWMSWAQKCGKNLVDIGTPLGPGTNIASSGNAPSTTEVVGYSLLKADDMEHAQKLLEGHPHLGWADGCTIDVHEKLPLPGSPEQC